MKENISPKAYFNIYRAAYIFQISLQAYINIYRAAYIFQISPKAYINIYRAAYIISISPQAYIHLFREAYIFQISRSIYLSRNLTKVSFSPNILSRENLDKPESLEEFYKRKFNWLPENIRNDIGHFNMFRLEPYSQGKTTSIPYRRRDFYKVMLVKGKSEVFYADQVMEVKKQALAFSNPLIPYKWEHHENLKGQYCIFNQHFMHDFGNISQYEIFQPTGNHVFELSDKQVEEVEAVFKKMEANFSSEYKYKYDSIRSLILELIHYGLKLQPNTLADRQPFNASQRISAMFLELLERQFPVEDNHPQIGLRSASEFAEHLNVHVNHLNRAVKETTGKTTSQVIAERQIQEAKVLLKHSKWNVSDIAYALGFTEVTHFNNFFKKHLQTSPLKFRAGQ